MLLQRPTLAWSAPLVVIGAGLLGVVPILAFALSQGGTFSFDRYVLHVTAFTVWQASLSTLLSVVPAIGLARALARQNFPGRDMILALFAVPMAMPAIVAVLSVLTVFGASGVLGGLFPVYGLAGIVFTHVFFNLPLASLMLHRALTTIPVESHRLAAELDFNDFSTFHHIDWPVLRGALPHVAALVFLLCAGSFVVVLTLGGPAATTLEVAIFHALRMDFDVPRVAGLSAIQIVISSCLVAFLALSTKSEPLLTPLRVRGERFDGRTTIVRVIDSILLLAAGLILLPPLASLIVTGVSSFSPNHLMAQAFATSAGLAVFSALLTLCLAVGLVQLQRQSGWPMRLATVTAFMGFIVPPAVMATGWFLATRQLAGGLWLALALIISLNALMALPFAVSALAAGYRSLGDTHEKLCQSLGLAGLARLVVIDLPALKPVVLQALLLAFATSFGDLTAVTLLGAQGLVTLPSLVAEQMGHFQSRAASGTALLLATLCLAASYAAQRLGRGR